MSMTPQRFVAPAYTQALVGSSPKGKASIEVLNNLGSIIKALRSHLRAIDGYWQREVDFLHVTQHRGQVVPFHKFGGHGVSMLHNQSKQARQTWLRDETKQSTHSGHGLGERNSCTQLGSSAVQTFGSPICSDNSRHRGLSKGVTKTLGQFVCVIGCLRRRAKNAHESFQGKRALKRMKRDVQNSFCTFMGVPTSFSTVGANECCLVAARRGEKGEKGSWNCPC
eukprot:1137815-Pelagomonas_calceolata.AAC.2